MRTYVPYLVIVLGLASTGCSSEIKVREINQAKIETGDTVDGIPFRKLTRYVVQIYEKGSDKKYKLVEGVKGNVQSLPDPDRLYVLQFDSGAFANANPEIAINSDSTLGQVTLKTDSQGSQAIDAVTTQIGNLKDEVEAREAAKKTALTNEDTLLNSYYEAKILAEEAELAFAALPSPTTVDKSKLDLVKRKANIAARDAGKLAPYPDVGR